MLHNRVPCLVLLRADHPSPPLHVCLCVCTCSHITSQGWTAVMSRAMHPYTGQWRGTRWRAAGLFWTLGPTPTSSTWASCPLCTWLSALNTTIWWRWGSWKRPAKTTIYSIWSAFAPVFLCILTDNKFIADALELFRHKWHTIYWSILWDK